MIWYECNVPPLGSSDLCQAKGLARDSIAQKMIRKLDDKYAGTPSYGESELIARNITGVAYAGESDFNLENTTKYAHRLYLYSAGTDTVRTILSGLYFR